IQQIDEREGNIAALPCESLCRKAARVLGRFRAGALARQAPQAIQLAPRDDLLRVLRGRAEDAARLAVIVRQSRERERDVGFLEVAAAQQRHQQVGLAGRSAGREGFGESALEYRLPYLAPDLSDGATERRGMPRRPAEADEAIVVK